MKFTPDTYDRVTNIIVAALERAIEKRNQGKKDWNCPWVQTAGGQPMSLSTGRPYRGMNFVLLSMLSVVYPSQLFGTAKKWNANGHWIKKGERANLVLFWKKMETIDKVTGEKKKFWMARGYNVFAAEQIKDFDIEAYLKQQNEKLPNIAERIETAENAMNAYCESEKLTVNYGGNRAFYSISKDFVQMPLREAFKSTEALYSTLAHELAHSTGHENRLNRNFKERFGSEAYAFEELVAELSASMISSILGIVKEPKEESVDYLASWLKVLRDDKKAIFTAASQAQKATDMVLKSLTASEEVDEEDDLDVAA